MRVLMIGLGGIGQRHARNLRAILGDRLELLAYRVRGLTHVVTPNLESDAGRNVEQEYRIRAFPDLDAAFSHGPQIAFICNPTSSHLSAAGACLRAGCDVFIEKPLSSDAQGVENLIDLANQKRRVVMVGYQLRFHPCLLKFSLVIESGCLGHLLSVRTIIGENLANWHPYEDYRQMYAARANLGGGVVLSQIHEFDYLYSLFGLPAKLFAIGGHWSQLEIDVEDAASILMEASTEGRPLPIHLHQDYLQAPPTRQCEVIGDRGRAILDFRAVSVTVHDFSGNPPIVHSFPGFERNQLFMDEVRHFLKCVENRSTPIVDLRAGFQSLRMALAVKRSMATGMPVELVAQDAECASG
jgi:predicted dehydrogenase